MARGFSVHVGVSFTNGFAEEAPGCGEAAQALAARLQGLGFAVAAPIIDDEATLPNVEERFRKVFEDLSDNDLLVVSLAGHGRQSPDGGDEEEPANQFFALFNQWWKDDDIKGLLAEITVRARVLFIAQACASASLVGPAAFLARLVDKFSPSRVAGRRALARAAREPRMSDDTLLARLTADVLQLAACKENEKTLAAMVEGGLPPFTEALLAEMETGSDYPDLRTRIRTRITPPNPSPVLNTRFVRDGAFITQRPFTV